MSLYAKYLTERTHDRIVEVEHGFATYRFLADQRAVYIVDLFVDPDFRLKGLATLLADKIAGIAKKEGYVKMLGTVVPSSKGSTESIKILLAYGMRVESSAMDMIVFEKGLV